MSANSDGKEKPVQLKPEFSRKRMTFLCTCSSVPVWRTHVLDDAVWVCVVQQAPRCWIQNTFSLLATGLLLWAGTGVQGHPAEGCELTTVGWDTPSTGVWAHYYWMTHTQQRGVKLTTIGWDTPSIGVSSSLLLVEAHPAEGCGAHYCWLSHLLLTCWRLTQKHPVATMGRPFWEEERNSQSWASSLREIGGPQELAGLSEYLQISLPQSGKDSVLIESSGTFSFVCLFFFSVLTTSLFSICEGRWGTEAKCGVRIEERTSSFCRGLHS